MSDGNRPPKRISAFPQRDEASPEWINPDLSMPDEESEEVIQVGSSSPMIPDIWIPTEEDEEESQYQTVPEALTRDESFFSVPSGQGSAVKPLGRSLEYSNEDEPYAKRRRLQQEEEEDDCYEKLENISNTLQEMNVAYMEWMVFRFCFKKELNPRDVCNLADEERQYTFKNQYLQTEFDDWMRSNDADFQDWTEKWKDAETVRREWRNCNMSVNPLQLALKCPKGQEWRVDPIFWKKTVMAFIASCQYEEKNEIAKELQEYSTYNDFSNRVNGGPGSNEINFPYSNAIEDWLYSYTEDKQVRLTVHIAHWIKMNDCTTVLQEGGNGVDDTVPPVFTDFIHRGNFLFLKNFF